MLHRCAWLGKPVGGGDGNRTRVQGFAGPCLSHSATPPQRPCRKGIRTLRADDGIRTRDPHLGKVMLYQLSHVRALACFSTVADPAVGANSNPRIRAAGHASTGIERRLGYRRKMTVPAHSVPADSVPRAPVPDDPVPYVRVPYEADLAPAAPLIAAPTRAAMLRALLAGRPLAAGELARLAGVSAATASFHLAKLLDGNMITAARQGRHRYYRLAGHEIAAALEAIGSISTALPVRSLRQSQEAVALAEARTCYDHLAGRAGVGLLDALLGQGLLTREKSKSLGRTGRGDSASTRFVVTGAGARTLASFGINVAEVRRSRRRFAGECIDWT